MGRELMRADGAQMHSVSRNTLNVRSIQHILLTLSVITFFVNRGTFRKDGVLRRDIDVFTSTQSYSDRWTCAEFSALTTAVFGSC